jgi:hypothetical protein
VRGLPAVSLILAVAIAWTAGLVVLAVWLGSMGTTWAALGAAVAVVEVAVAICAVVMVWEAWIEEVHEWMAGMPDPS